MIEQCANEKCNAEIEYTGDPQYVTCPVCGGITFRYTWGMCMTREEIATENLLTFVDVWFASRAWLSNNI
jgi:hypothetical protein